MSLEVQIETLNSNIVALIGALENIGRAAEPAPEVVPDKLTAAKRPSKVAEEKAAEPKPEAPALITFEMVKKAVLSYAAKDYAAAKAMLAKHGAKKVQDLPESLYAAVLFEAQAACGE